MDTTFKTLLDTADSALAAGEDAALHAALDQALRLESVDAYDVRCLGDLLMLADRYQDAAGLWQTLLMTDVESRYFQRQSWIARGHLGDEAAIAFLADQLILQPHDPEILIALTQAHYLTGDLKTAWQMLEDTALLIDDAKLWYQLGQMRARAGEYLTADMAFNRALELDSTLSGRVEQARAQLIERIGHDPAFIKGLFDQYADRFDQHLTENLNYRAPELLAKALKAAGCPRGRVLDLGCGTGLSGRALKPFASHMTGIDLSPAMLAKAAETGIYDALHEGEVVAWMKQDISSYDLICAIDTVVYIADLTELFEAAALRLSKNGWLALTAEDVETDAAFHEKESRRFGHSEAYLRAAACAAGLTVACLSPITPRMDRGTPIAGWCLIAKR